MRDTTSRSGPRLSHPCVEQEPAQHLAIQGGGGRNGGPSHSPAVPLPYLVLVPVAIYWIGPQLLGEFGGHGFADFFGSLGARIRSGEAAAWFLVLMPYLVVMVLRLTRFGWRSTRQSAP